MSLLWSEIKKIERKKKNMFIISYTVIVFLRKLIIKFEWKDLREKWPGKNQSQSLYSNEHSDS